MRRALPYVRQTKIMSIIAVRIVQREAEAGSVCQGAYAIIKEQSGRTRRNRLSAHLPEVGQKWGRLRKFL